jgi:hypothetical protein
MLSNKDRGASADGTLLPRSPRREKLLPDGTLRIVALGREEDRSESGPLGTDLHREPKLFCSIRSG